ncbi:hypothetical protein BpHYR1_012184 [Brachionus plicatilis]|uniref:Uncharacterized protein n=1 Tax=Brachionus plicatilis TaxID=10195 RepID=A0A3M7Q735_BRAPC|nr:hypothetical protein BpHYR1_012184 [Brachionus plicatilis]
MSIDTVKALNTFLSSQVLFIQNSVKTSCEKMGKLFRTKIFPPINETILNAKWISSDKSWHMENYLCSDSWYEYEGTKKRSEYKLVSFEDDQTLTANECLFCKSQNEINYSLALGYWELKPQEKRPASVV